MPKPKKPKQAPPPAAGDDGPVAHGTGATLYRDFRSGASWRIFRIMSEFIEGFEFLADLRREVTIFGSARVPEKSPLYAEARKLGRLLGQAGFAVITGGGPGIMEAANRGAAEAHGQSVGLNIVLPKEQRINPYVKKGMGFYYFFTRKVMLAISSQAYIYFPGGIGTVNEFFEILELIQTKKSEPFPVVLVGREWWTKMLDWMRETMVPGKFIEPEDLKLFSIVDTAEEAFNLVKDTQEREYP